MADVKINPFHDFHCCWTFTAEIHNCTFTSRFSYCFYWLINWRSSNQNVPFLLIQPLYYFLRTPRGEILSFQLHSSIHFFYLTYWRMTEKHWTPLGRGPGSAGMLNREIRFLHPPKKLCLDSHPDFSWVYPSVLLRVFVSRPTWLCFLHSGYMTTTMETSK